MITIEEIVEEISNIKVKALNCSIKIQEQGLEIATLDEIFQKTLMLEQKIRNTYKIGRFYKE